MQPPVQPMHAARRTRPCMNAEMASMTVQEGDSAGARFATTGCSATFSLAISSADCSLRFRFSATSSVTHTHCADPSPTKHQHPSDQTRTRQGGGSVRLLRSLLRAAWLCCESNRNKPMATSTTWRAAGREAHVCHGQLPDKRKDAACMRGAGGCAPGRMMCPQRAVRLDLQRALDHGLVAFTESWSSGRRT